jgi:hypothetical protein
MFGHLCPSSFSRPIFTPGDMNFKSGTASRLVFLTKIPFSTSDSGSEELQEQELQKW